MTEEERKKEVERISRKTQKSVKLPQTNRESSVLFDLKPETLQVI